MKRCFSVLWVLALAAGCTVDIGAADRKPEGELGEASDEVYYESDLLWPNREISVCWVRDSGTAEAGWVKYAVEKAWEEVADIDLVGWDDCANHATGSGASLRYDADIKIDVSKNYWPASKVGTEALNFPTGSMFFNWFLGAKSDLDADGTTDFDYCRSATTTYGATGTDWNTGRRRCIEVIAAHEFGHALGLAHEQNRPENQIRRDNNLLLTHPFCDLGGEDKYDNYGDTTAFGFDQVSIMNYCSPVWNNDGYPSAYDIAGMHLLYGRSANDYRWSMFGSGKSLTGADIPGLIFETTALNVRGTYQYVLSGDFDGRGGEDVLWYQPGSGNDYVWYTNAIGEFSSSSNLGVGGTYVPVVGDFNSDVRDDIYWYSPTGTDYLWLGKEDKTFDQSVTPKQFSQSGTFIPVAGDFDGDSRTDILWYQAGSGADYMWWGATNPGAFSTGSMEVSGTYTPVAGDFDADKRTDIFWYGPGSAADRTWFGASTRAFDTSRSLGTSNITARPIVGDFDYSGTDDILFDRASGGDDYVWLTDGGTVPDGGFKMRILDDYQIVAGDFDANGTADLILYTPG